MMWPYYGGPGLWVMGLGAILMWGLFAALLFVLVRAVAGPPRGGDSALEVLRRRLASGEITPEEFEKTRRMLEA